jgi:hypothetical protein
MHETARSRQTTPSISKIKPRSLHTRNRLTRREPCAPSPHGDLWHAFWSWWLLLLSSQVCSYRKLQRESKESDGLTTYCSQVMSSTRDFFAGPLVFTTRLKTELNRLQYRPSLLYCLCFAAALVWNLQALLEIDLRQDFEVEPCSCRNCFWRYDLLRSSCFVRSSQPFSLCCCYIQYTIYYCRDGSILSASRPKSSSSFLPTFRHRLETVSDGVNVDDCQNFSRAISFAIDARYWWMECDYC